MKECNDYTCHSGQTLGQVYPDVPLGPFLDSLVLTSQSIASLICKPSSSRPTSDCLDGFIAQISAQVGAALGAPFVAKGKSCPALCNSVGPYVCAAGAAAIAAQKGT